MSIDSYDYNPRYGNTGIWRFSLVNSGTDPLSDIAINSKLPRGRHPLSPELRYQVTAVRDEVTGVLTSSVSLLSGNKKTPQADSSLHGTHIVKPARFGSDRFGATHEDHIRGKSIVVDLRSVLKTPAVSSSPLIITKGVVQKWKTFDPQRVNPELGEHTIADAGAIALMRVLPKDLEESEDALTQFPHFVDPDAVNSFVEAFNKKTRGDLRVLYYGAPSVERPDVVAMKEPVDGIGGAHGAFDRKRVSLVTNCNLAGDAYRDGNVCFVDPRVDQTYGYAFPDAVRLAGVQAIPLSLLERHLGRHGMDLNISAKVFSLAQKLAKKAGKKT